MNYQDRGLVLENLSIGVDTAGLETYKESLKSSLLTEVENKVNDISTITTALDKGWQGVSRDAFDKKFEAMRGKVTADLNSEYANLVARIEELAYDYIKQDQNMVVE